MYQIKLTDHAKKRMQERTFKRDLLVNIIKNIDVNDFKKYIKSKYIYLAVRDTKKEKSVVIAVEKNIITVITVTNNIIRCNDFKKTCITNIS